MRRQTHTQQDPQTKRKFKYFGEWVTADELKLYGDKDEDKDGKTAGHVINDLATNMLGFAAEYTGSGPELLKALHFHGQCHFGNILL